MNWAWVKLRKNFHHKTKLPWWLQRNSWSERERRRKSWANFHTIRPLVEKALPETNFPHRMPDEPVRRRCCATCKRQQQKQFHGVYNDGTYLTNTGLGSLTACRKDHSNHQGRQWIHLDIGPCVHRFQMFDQDRTGMESLNRVFIPGQKLNGVQ